MPVDKLITPLLREIVAPLFSFDRLRAGRFMHSHQQPPELSTFSPSYAQGCTWSAQQPSSQVIDGCLDLQVLGNLEVDLLDGVDDGGMVLSAEFFAYFRIGCLGELTAEVNGDLTRHHQSLEPFLRLQFRNLELEMVSHLFLDDLDGQFPGL